MKIQFCGATTGVTGSCHLITTAHHKVLLDCGQFQGGKAQEELNKHGLTTIHVNKAGEENLVIRPEHYVVQACVKQIKAFCTEFGMTPSSRARLMLPSEKAAADPLENLIQ